MSKSDLEALFQTVENVLEGTGRVYNENTFWNLVFCLQLASGRRLIEILVTLKYEPGPTRYQAKVKGIAKKQWEVAMNFGEETEYIIPLSVPYSLFESGMKLIREYRSYEGMDALDLGHAVGVRLGAASNRACNRRLTHTQKRNLYLEKVYEDREINRFHVGEESCSHRVWVADALCHSTPPVTETDRYTVMQIIE